LSQNLLNELEYILVKSAREETSKYSTITGKVRQQSTSLQIKDFRINIGHFTDKIREFVKGRR
jgi:hypothetical protein